MNTARGAAELIWKAYERHLSNSAHANQDKDSFILNVSGIITQVVVQDRNGRDALKSTSSVPTDEDAIKVGGAIYEETCQIAQDDEASGHLTLHAVRFMRLGRAAINSIQPSTK